MLNGVSDYHNKADTNKRAEGVYFGISKPLFPHTPRIRSRNPTQPKRKNIMKAIEAYELWYIGAAEHELMTASKNKMLVDTSLALLDSGVITGKQMAERLMTNLEFDTKQLDSYSRYNGSGSYSVSKAHSREIDRVHKACSDEIRATWDSSQISDKQLQDALFTDAAKPLLDQIPNEVKATLTF